MFFFFLLRYGLRYIQTANHEKTCVEVDNTEKIITLINCSCERRAGLCGGDRGETGVLLFFFGGGGATSTEQQRKDSLANPNKTGTVFYKFRFC